MVLVPIENKGFLYVKGLELEYPTSSVKIPIKSGRCRDSSDVNDIVLNEKVVIDGAVTGVNGLDTGDIQTNKVYYVYLIGDSTEYRPTAATLSLDPTQPSLPGGYDIYRRVGTVLTNATGDFYSHAQSGSDHKRTVIFETSLGLTLPSPLPIGFPEGVSCKDKLPILADEVFLRVTYKPEAALTTGSFGFNPFGLINGNGIVRYNVFVNDIVVFNFWMTLKFNGDLPSVSMVAERANDVMTAAVIGYREDLTRLS